MFFFPPFTVVPWLTFPCAKSCPLCNITALHFWTPGLEVTPRTLEGTRAHRRGLALTTSLSIFDRVFRPACVRFGRSAAWQFERLKAFRRMKRLKCQHSSLQRARSTEAAARTPTGTHPPTTSVGENDNSDRMAYNWLSQSTG